MAISANSLTPMLWVYDMRRSVAFYHDVLGFEVVGRYEPGGHLYWAELKLGNAALMLNAEYEDDERPPESQRKPVHGTTLYFRCDDADAVHAQVLAKGWPAKEPETTYYNMRQVHLRDPDGFDLCFHHRARA